MRIVITGASGLLGANLAVALREAGHEVACTRRGRSRIDHLGDVELRWVEADLGDEPSLARAFEGAEIVYHCAAMVSVRQRRTPAIDDANVAGTERVLSAARAAGVRRVVHTSSTVTTGIATGPADVDESAAWNFPEHGLADAYSTTKREAEERAIAAAAAGQDVVIVNPGYMFGPRDTRPSSGKLLLELHRRAIPALTPGTNSFVDVHDVVRGMMLAAEKGRSGERYILGGHNLRYSEAFPRFAEWLGCRAPRLSLPSWLSAPLGWIGDLQERFSEAEPFINSAVVRYGYCDGFRFSSEKAKRELGYTIGPLEPAVKASFAWMKAHGVG